MTTALMEQGSHLDSGESNRGRNAYYDALEEASRKARFAGAVALSKTTMDTQHPHYGEWLAHVEIQPHQGC